MPSGLQAFKLAFVTAARPEANATRFSSRNFSGTRWARHSHQVSSGNGSSQHLVGALFGQMAGVNLNHVPYKGSGQAMQDLVGGQVKVSFVGAPNAVPYLNAGKLRALGVTTKKRSADLPDIPSIDEAGVPGYDATLWLGLLAPPGTPADVIAKLREGVTKALSSPEARKLVNSAGVDVALSTPEEFAALMRSEFERWGNVVRETGATVN